MDFEILKTRFIAHVDAKPALKYILLIQLSGFLLSLIRPIADALVLVPSNLFYLHLWRVVSNPIVENNLIIISWSMYCFYQFLMYIQPNWPLEESAKFFIIVQLASNFSLVISTLFLYVLFGFIYPFYTAQIYGSSVLALATLIAFKQFLPDTVLLTTPFGRLKNGHLPFASICLSILLWPFGLVRGMVPFQLMFSMQISWAYLRFYQSRGGIGESLIGDHSDHFCWASLFPRRLQPLATVIGRLTFRSLHRLGILRRVIRREHLDMMEEHNLEMETLETVKVETAGAAVLAPESWDAERKRQKALRMLNERLVAQQRKQKEGQERNEEKGEEGGMGRPNQRDGNDGTGRIDGQRPESRDGEEKSGQERQRAEADDEEVRFYLDNQRSSSEKEQSQPPPQPSQPRE